MDVTIVRRDLGNPVAVVCVQPDMVIVIADPAAPDRVVTAATRAGEVYAAAPDAP